MYIHYDAKTDYLEVLEKKGANYSEIHENGIYKIHSEKNKKIVGYGIENASIKIEALNFFEPLIKFSIMIKILRLKKGLTQIQAAKKLGISLLPYQRIESGKNNPTLKTILRIKEVFPELKLDKVA
ncbi:MAG: helix-turn-helix transcriptional regulator [Bacteriovoracaceae bacterium]|nr:helix-turn-helix transcriptional regulator [Bacteriovoracaceae bacterium]